MLMDYKTEYSTFIKYSNDMLDMVVDNLFDGESIKRDRAMFYLGVLCNHAQQRDKELQIQETLEEAEDS